jgi:hypothetical protein
MQETLAPQILEGADRVRAQETICENHYTRSVPSGKSFYVRYGSAIVVYSIPANKNISRWLLGEDNAVWELSRLWAPDGHERNLLSRAISESLSVFRSAFPSVQGIVSYADPNAGHTGGVYRAASWVALGQCEENRAYRDAQGVIVSRRAFHSGSRSLRKAEIEALGYVQLKTPGKLRFAKGLTRKSRRKIQKRLQPAS